MELLDSHSDGIVGQSHSGGIVGQSGLFSVYSRELFVLLS